jgi:hypothetical protein
MEDKQLSTKNNKGRITPALFIKEKNRYGT